MQRFRLVSDDSGQLREVDHRGSRNQGRQLMNGIKVVENKHRADCKRRDKGVKYLRYHLFDDCPVTGKHDQQPEEK